MSSASPVQDSPPPAARQRRNAAQTKRRIIVAAQQFFATRGYASTRLGDVALAAGVATSLIPQHFGSKADLFEIALTEAMAASRVLEVPDAQLAEVIIEHGLNDDQDIRLPAMIVLSIGEPNASEIAGRITREKIIPGLAARLGAPNGTERAMEITMISTGFLLYARQLPTGAVSEATKRDIIGILQAIIDRRSD